MDTAPMQGRQPMYPWDGDTRVHHLAISPGGLSGAKSCLEIAIYATP
jgi:hypothetical protein